DRVCKQKEAEGSAGEEPCDGTRVLAVIEPNAPEFLDARARATAQAHLKAAEMTRAQTGPAVERARASLAFAENELKRITSLPPGGTSQKEQQESEMMLRNRTEELKSAQFAEKVAEFEVEQARAALKEITGESSSGDRPARLSLGSPINGVVLKVEKESA